MNCSKVEITFDEMSKGRNNKESKIAKVEMTKVCLSKLHRKKISKDEMALVLYVQKLKASVTILAGLARSLTLHFSGAVNTRQKMIVYINNLLPSEFPNRSSRSARSSTSTLICT